MKRSLEAPHAPVRRDERADGQGARTPSQSPRASPARARGLAVWLLAARPRTLGASLAPVAVGLAFAGKAGPLDAGIAVLTATAAVLLQIAANLANDYYDALAGVDGAGRLGPVRVTQAGLVTPQAMRRAVLVVLAAATLAGLVLVRSGGVVVLAAGLASIVAAISYSTRPLALAERGLGEIAVFGFFGLVATGGTYYLQRGGITAEVLAASLVPASLAAALLAVNNLRDIDGDRAAGRRTLAVRLGARGARIEITILVGSAFLVAVAFAVAVDAGAALVLAAAPLAWRVTSVVWRSNGRALNAAQAETARLLVVASGLLAFGVWL